MKIEISLLPGMISFIIHEDHIILRIFVVVNVILPKQMNMEWVINVILNLLVSHLTDSTTEDNSTEAMAQSIIPALLDIVVIVMSMIIHIRDLRQIGIVLIYHM